MTDHKLPWFKRIRTWFILFFLICLSLFITTLPAELPQNLAYLAKAYSEPEIVEGALAITKKNPKIIALLGELEPMSKFDMIEGSVIYSKENDSVAITIGIRGKKMIRSNMDLLAQKINNKWEYQFINVRIKGPKELKQTIPILKN